MCMQCTYTDYRKYSSEYNNNLHSSNNQLDNMMLFLFLLLVYCPLTYPLSTCQLSATFNILLNILFYYNAIYFCYYIVILLLLLFFLV